MPTAVRELYDPPAQGAPLPEVIAYCFVKVEQPLLDETNVVLVSLMILNASLADSASHSVATGASRHHLGDCFGRGMNLAHDGRAQ